MVQVPVITSRKKEAVADAVDTYEVGAWVVPRTARASRRGEGGKRAGADGPQSREEHRGAALLPPRLSARPRLRPARRALPHRSLHSDDA